MCVKPRTRKKSDSTAWLQKISGRVAASKLKSGCHANIEKPSPSLIKRTYKWKWLLQKGRRGLKTKPLQKIISRVNGKGDENFPVSGRRFYINPEWLFMGTSPFGLVNWKCWGTYFCEIRWHKTLDILPREAAVVKGEKRHIIYIGCILIPSVGTVKYP